MWMKEAYLPTPLGSRRESMYELYLIQSASLPPAATVPLLTEYEDLSARTERELCRLQRSKIVENSGNHSSKWPSQAWVQSENVFLDISDTLWADGFVTVVSLYSSLRFKHNFIRGYFLYTYLVWENGNSRKLEWSYENI